jgi:hypothetical protein
MLKATSVYKQRQKPYFSRGPRILRVQYVWVLEHKEIVEMSEFNECFQLPVAFQ